LLVSHKDDDDDDDDDDNDYYYYWYYCHTAIAVGCPVWAPRL